MNSKLNHVDDWLMLALRANWSVSNLAKLCDVSRRTLFRHFRAKHGKSPKLWLTEQRQRYAAELVFTGLPIKEIAARAGYTSAANFSRGFKKAHGAQPTKLATFTWLAQKERKWPKMNTKTT